VCSVTSMRNTKLQTQLWSQSWGKCFLFISVYNDVCNFHASSPCLSVPSD
jgi:hypothetical protein